MKKILTGGRSGRRRHRPSDHLPDLREGGLLLPEERVAAPVSCRVQIRDAAGVFSLPGYVMYYFLATGVTPAMEEKMIGRGSQYAWACEDANQNPLYGGKNQGVLVSDHSDAFNVGDRSTVPSVSSQTKGTPGQRGRFSERLFRSEGARR